MHSIIVNNVSHNIYAFRQNLENEFDQRFLEDKEQFLINKQKALQEQVHTVLN